MTARGEIGRPPTSVKALDEICIYAAHRWIRAQEACARGPLECASCALAYETCRRAYNDRAEAINGWLRGNVIRVQPPLWR